MAVTKDHITSYLFENTKLSRPECKLLVEAFFDEIRQALANGEEVKLSGFGKFALLDKPERPGRNPKTGEPCTISARRVVAFHASQQLRQLVNHSD